MHVNSWAQCAPKEIPWSFSMTPQKDYDSPEFEAEVASHALSLRGKKLTVALAFVTGTGFTLFG